MVEVENMTYSITMEFDMELAASATHAALVEVENMTMALAASATHGVQDGARSCIPCFCTNEPNEIFKYDMEPMNRSAMELLNERFVLEPSKVVGYPECFLECESSWIGTTYGLAHGQMALKRDWSPATILLGRIGPFPLKFGLRCLLLASVHESLARSFSMAFACMASIFSSTSLLCMSWISSYPMTTCSFMVFLFFMMVTGMVKCWRRNR